MVTKDMTIGELMRLDGDLAPILLSHGMHCLGCPMSLRETLEEACQVHGEDVDAVIEEINEFLAKE